jgi:glycosyltransferase involved in cell wall biosynthesis
MPKGKINITVLMPAYNCSRFITSAVKSILNQTYHEFEFLIIDDGSTDNTEEKISAIKDSRIIYKKTGNKGTAAALNYGISIASGNWIARLDADDLNIPTRLEKQVNFISSNPNIDILSSWSVYFKDSHKILFSLKEPVEHEDIYNYLNLHNPINSSSTLLRKSVIKKAKYDENFTANEDFELFFRIRNDVRFHNIPEFLTYNRVRPDSKTFTADNSDIFTVINDYAMKQLINSVRKRDQFYWATTIAWQNFFYGDRKNSRSYFKRVPSVKNYTALAATYLTDKLFKKLLDSRTRYRMGNLFTGKKSYKEELKMLVSE